MHHRVADAPWSDQTLLSAVAERVVPQLIDGEQMVHRIVGDTGFLKKGKHSVRVARQYCGQTGQLSRGGIAVDRY